METPNIAETSPEVVELEAGKTYAWCACGGSGLKTFCDGSHKVTSFTPKVFTAEKSGKFAICRCKRSKNAPFCDGSHNDL